MKTIAWTVAPLGDTERQRVARYWDASIHLLDVGLLLLAVGVAFALLLPDWLATDVWWKRALLLLGGGTLAILVPLSVIAEYIKEGQWGLRQFAMAARSDPRGLIVLSTVPLLWGLCLLVALLPEWRPAVLAVVRPVGWWGCGVIVGAAVLAFGVLNVLRRWLEVTQAVDKLTNLREQRPDAFVVVLEHYLDRGYCYAYDSTDPVASALLWSGVYAVASQRLHWYTRRALLLLAQGRDPAAWVRERPPAQ